LAWDHPYMPWDAAELWVADLDGTDLRGAQRVSGSPDASVCSLAWLPDGRLAFSLDTSGYWEVHLLDGDDVSRVSWFEADCGSPGWQFGASSIAPLPDGRLACILTERAT